MLLLSSFSFHLKPNGKLLWKYNSITLILYIYELTMAFKYMLSDLRYYISMV
jgi:hypothetical protein